MKKILFVMVFFLFAKNGIAQISFKIENINVSNVIEEYAREDYDDSDYGRGPFITAYCSIINNNNDTLLLLTSKSKPRLILNIIILNIILILFLFLLLCLMKKIL